MVTNTDRHTYSNKQTLPHSHTQTHEFTHTHRHRHTQKKKKYTNSQINIYKLKHIDFSSILYHNRLTETQISNSETLQCWRLCKYNNTTDAHCLFTSNITQFSILAFSLTYYKLTYLHTVSRRDTHTPHTHTHTHTHTHRERETHTHTHRQRQEICRNCVSAVITHLNDFRHLLPFQNNFIKVQHRKKNFSMGVFLGSYDIWAFRNNFI